MITIYKDGAWFRDGKLIPAVPGEDEEKKTAAKRLTMAYGILSAHNTGSENELKIKFDALASHDITYVGIIQTARASGLERFPLPYVLTNCHNSLCAVGGTINEDDHLFGLSAAKRYGGIYVPAHQAVIHQYMREMFAGCGKMILGSDSHTRYGALGTMAIGEGGGELVKQLLGRTYDITRPETAMVYLTGTPLPGVGPQDVALALIGAVFENGFVKNRVLEFCGDGIAALSADYRIAIDVMTTETTCLSSIWQTDEKIREFLACHSREDEYRKLTPGDGAYYERAVKIDLSKIKPMIALPYHPSNVCTIEDLNKNGADILRMAQLAGEKQIEGPSVSLLEKLDNDGRLHVEQGVIGGCAGGGFESLSAAAQILKGADIGRGEFALSVYPASQPIMYALTQSGAAADLIVSGATIRTAFCGPCFGAGDTPANGCLSIRHSTRNFPNREGSKPSSGQSAAVALMDARSIAATARNRGALTPAGEEHLEMKAPLYFFEKKIYENRVYDGRGRADSTLPLRFGPNIVDWPEMISLTDNIILIAAAEIFDPVTTTDELIPSGETSSYRSNPLGLAQFTLSRKDPGYVKRAEAVQMIEKARLSGEEIFDGQLLKEKEEIKKLGFNIDSRNTSIGSVIYAIKPGDGSAREQAASCQKVLGGFANIAGEYATKRYRSNLINWGMLPFVLEGDPPFEVGDVIFIPGIKEAVLSKAEKVKAYLPGRCEMELSLGSLTDEERRIIAAGCLINYYKKS